MTGPDDAMASATTLTTPGAVVTILTDPGDWQEAVRDAARLAAETGRRLKVVLADGDELVNAAALDCVSLVASRGPARAIDPQAARRLVNAQTGCLRRELELLGRRLGIEIELTVLAPGAAGFWAGSTALTIFGRRRRGALLVIHAGTRATLDVAARLAAGRGQRVRLLAAAAGTPPGDAAELSLLLGRWLEAPPEPLALDQPLHIESGGRIAAIVLDPAYVETRKLSAEALLNEIRRLMRLA